MLLVLKQVLELRLRIAAQSGQYSAASVLTHVLDDVGALVGGEAFDNLSGAFGRELFEGRPLVPNVLRALSLVPDAVRQLKELSTAHYLPIDDVVDPRARGPVLSRAQMELVAGRVSALNECFY